MWYPTLPKTRVNAAALLGGGPELISRPKADLIAALARLLIDSFKVDSSNVSDVVQSHDSDYYYSYEHDGLSQLTIEMQTQATLRARDLQMITCLSTLLTTRR